MSTGSVKFKAVVPARYASTRLPGKPLLDLGGKPMVVRVAERALASGAEDVLVATDHADVHAAVQACGLRVLLTRADHPRVPTVWRRSSMNAAGTTRRSWSMSRGTNRSSPPG